MTIAVIDQLSSSARDILAARDGPLAIARVPEGLDALVLGDMVRGRGPGSLSLHIARDDQRLARLKEGLAFFAPEIEVLQFPAWDCLPYDRVSPSSAIISRRLASLAALSEAPTAAQAGRIVLTTVNACLQRFPVKTSIEKWPAAIGDRIDLEQLSAYLVANGYLRVATVGERGEFAVRGGIIDVFAPGTSDPVRLDLFGDTLDALRTFDAETQRTIGKLDHITLLPAGEVTLGSENITRFRERYTASFGAVTGVDPLYEAISQGRRYQGMEHWLPLFHENLLNVFDYLPDAEISIDHLADEAASARLEQIEDYYQARISAGEKENLGVAVYRPLPTDALYLTAREWRRGLDDRAISRFTPFEQVQTASMPVISLDGRQARNFAAEREKTGTNVFDAVAGHIGDLEKTGKRIVIACWSEGALSRLETVLGDHGVTGLVRVADWAGTQALDKTQKALAVLGLEAGFETDDLSIIGEQDILGDRLVRRRARSRKPADILAQLASLNPGDFVVHVDHGIGRFEGLRTLEIQGARHDCLELIYFGGDKLFLPVENAELLTRYGGEEGAAQLDRLGGAAWQARKARLKQRIRDIAEKLIATAAARALRKGDVIELGDGLYDEFAARFPFEETDDQLSAIEAVLDDMRSGRPMDRLICGDVGFGKTEIALRSAFAVAMAGKQTAIVVPTTLLARQHYATFTERFAGLPVKIAQMSRLVSLKDMKKAREGIANGEIDIVIGTHALLAKSISFQDLSLLIIDEEQHFGVSHKEQLKALRAQVHVLTLTATPIPRTLQLALSGVRDLSLIATPPVDRLAVRTFITPFDPVIIREALLRELYRGGQSFYVCPRIADLDEVAAYLRQHVPEVKVAIAHGRMPPGQLDDIMTGFYDRQYDVLLSTTIIESGLDIPTANSLIVHRADMFGLSQLYQLRGRVGRSKIRAYALFTVPAGKVMNQSAERRLKVLQSLDTLGAGFSLASHDLDQRGAGNLLGEEQSGHIREVGYELYQNMLEEAVATLKDDDASAVGEDQWSPQINLGAAVLIPDSYINDLTLRLSLYRRLSSLTRQDDIEAFGAELIDRFGAYPIEVAHLLKVVTIKAHCLHAGVASIEAGTKGAVIGFRNDQVANPAGLIAFISQSADLARLRPDHKLVYKRNWTQTEARIDGVHRLLAQLVDIAEKA